MAETERARVFQAMRAIRALPSDVPERGRKEIDRRVKEWLRIENDPELQSCYEQVAAFLE